MTNWLSTTIVAALVALAPAGADIPWPPELGGSVAECPALADATRTVLGIRVDEDAVGLKSYGPGGDLVDVQGPAEQKLGRSELHEEGDAAGYRAWRCEEGYDFIAVYSSFRAVEADGKMVSFEVSWSETW